MSAPATSVKSRRFLSAPPLVSMEKGLYERGKRNLLTGGAASCYPFTSFEMCDDNGILLGVNKYNSSLIIVDIFNSAIYKNANMAILGTSGRRQNLYHAVDGAQDAAQKHPRFHHRSFEGA